MSGGLLSNKVFYCKAFLVYKKKLVVFKQAYVLSWKFSVEIKIYRKTSNVNCTKPLNKNAAPSSCFSLLSQLQTTKFLWY